MPVREFYRRRFARVVPAYVVAACIGIALDVWQYGSETFARGLFTLTLLQSWITGERFSYAGNSVGCRFQPRSSPTRCSPADQAGVRAESRRLIALLCSVLGLSIAWQLVLRGDYSETVSWAPYIAPPYRALEFVAGMCLARMLMTGVRLRLPVLAPVALAVAALLAGGISGRG